MKFLLYLAANLAISLSASLPVTILDILLEENFCLLSIHFVE